MVHADFLNIHYNLAWKDSENYFREVGKDLSHWLWPTCGQKDFCYSKYNWLENSPHLPTLNSQMLSLLRNRLYYGAFWNYKNCPSHTDLGRSLVNTKRYTGFNSGPLGEAGQIYKNVNSGHLNGLIWISCLFLLPVNKRV